MRNLLKNTFFLTLAISAVSASAQVRDNPATENQSVTSVISEDITSDETKTRNTVKALITKAERQYIGGLKKLYKIDEGIYRSEQPDQNDFIALEKMGVSEVLNVRRLKKDDRKARHTDLKLHHISMKAGDMKERDVIKALKIINDREGPILIHCWHGADRTGVLTAMYRVVFQNWTKDDAIHEMTKGNFGFHTAYSNLIDFVKEADVTKIKGKVFGKKATEQMQKAVASAAQTVSGIVL